jgi:hypothetical protein
MAMVCPDCNGCYDRSGYCPKCGKRLLYGTKATVGGQATADAAEGFLQTPSGRIVAGILLAQGLAYGLQLLCDGGFQVAEEDRQSIWSTLFGLVVLQAIQGLSLIAGGGLAGASQRRPWSVGALVGFVHGAIFLSVQMFQGHELTVVAMVGQPLLHIAFGTVGGVLGGCIWRPLPLLDLGDIETDLQSSSGTGLRLGRSILSGPVAWGRVFAGILLVSAGFLWGPALLSVVLDASKGKLRLNDQLQAQLVTWEVIGMTTLLGAAIAGATTRNGLKQGLFVGLGTSILLVGNQLGARGVSLENTLLTAGCIVALTIAGGWFGSQLFPPIARSLRRRVSTPGW